MSMDRLNVSQPFTLQDLKQFAEDAGGRKIRMKMEDGEKILYTSNKKDWGIRNFFTGHSEKREAKARHEIEKALGFVQLSAPKAALTGSKLHATMNRCGATVNVPTKDGQGTLNVPSTVTFGGKTYDHESHIATKGYGHVHCYKLQGGNEQIAVKILTDKPNDPSSEFALQQRASKEGDAVLGIKGVAVNPTDETIVVGMPLALGDCDTVATKLKDLEDQGLISAKTANAVRMTMLHDMAKGVEQASNAGIIHYDVKPDNFLIGSDGRAVIMDFGASQATEKGGTAPTKMLHWKDVGRDQQNLAMISPECHAQMEASVEKYRAAETLLRNQAKDAFFQLHPEVERPQNMSDLPTPKLRKEWTAFQKAFLDNPKLTKPTVELNSKVDSWGLGMAAFQLMKGVGQQPSFLDGANDNLQINAAMIQFGADSSNRVFGDPQSSMENVVNGLMHPDQKQRTSASDLLNSTTLYETPGIGSPEVRELMKALATGNNAGIQQYSDAINNLDPDVDANRRVQLFSSRKDEVLHGALENIGIA